MKTVNIICPDNGVGLSVDRRILKNLLESNGFKVECNAGQPKDFKKRYDINIHCEILIREYIGLAEKNVMIPNPEWFFNGWMPSLYRCNAVFCKTLDCKRIFDMYHKNCVHTSFTSDDKYDKEVLREKRFAHFAGKSSHKGTNAIIEATRIEKVPEVHLYCNDTIGIKPVDKNKVVLYTGRIDENKFNVARNRSLFHLCPSEYEGWGHYINEAKSIGAIIITTNAAPMNELVTPKFGFGASYDGIGTHHLAPTYKASPQSIAKCMKIASGMSDDMIKELSGNARESFLDNDKLFKERFMNEIVKL